MVEYRLYLNDFQVLDIPENVFSLEKTLIRDGGINNDEQIFRGKCESELIFYGDGYRYLCQKKAETICEDIDVRIERKEKKEWNIMFLGTLKHSNSIHLPTRCQIKCKIYDNSYSAMIMERKDNKFFLNLNKSVDNTAIAPCTSTSINIFGQLGFNAKKIVAFEVFEVFKYLIRLLTNDKVQVVSDLFTTGVFVNKYAVTTGAMLRFGANGGAVSNSFNNTYLIPELSYKDLFIELRKCFRIYSAIEYDSVGNAILRIENENYFFKSNTIFNIDEIPLDLEENFILDDIYSEIVIGSTNATPNETYYVPNIRLYAWQQETYNNCTNCTMQNELNLVNDWIIDSNLILEAINGVDAWDKNLFIIELQDLNNAKKYQEGVDVLPNIEGNANFYYNESLNNYNKLINWSGGIPECISNFYNQEKCNDSIYDTADDIKIQHSDIFTGTAHEGITYNMLRFGIENCDSIFIQNNDYNTQNCNIIDASVPAIVTLENNTFGSASIIQIPFTGQYKFETQVNLTNLLQVKGGNNIGPLEKYKVELKLMIFQGGFAQLEGGGNESPIEIVDTYNHSGNFDDSFNITLTVTTTLLNLNVGSVVAAVIRIRTKKLGLQTVSGDALQVNTGYLKILEQYYNFNENVPQATEAKRNIRIKFTYPICFLDYLNLQNNKYGIFKVGGLDAWIKEIKYIENDVSEITLIAKKSLCEI